MRKLPSDPQGSELLVVRKGWEVLAGGDAILVKMGP